MANPKTHTEAINEATGYAPPSSDPIQRMYSEEFAPATDEDGEAIPYKVGRATIALASYIDGDPEDRHSNVVDLLGDLRHYCDAHDVNWADAIRISFMHWQAERVEAGLD